MPAGIQPTRHCFGVVFSLRRLNDNRANLSRIQRELVASMSWGREREREREGGKEREIGEDRGNARMKVA
jgi:hypothetical protein